MDSDLVLIKLNDCPIGVLRSYAYNGDYPEAVESSCRAAWISGAKLRNDLNPGTNLYNRSYCVVRASDLAPKLQDEGEYSL